MKIVFSEGSGLNDSVYGKCQAPIRMFLEQRGEQFEELPVERFETHTRAFIKVEDGCNRQ
mgnify:CR=1 FL=1